MSSKGTSRSTIAFLTPSRVRSLASQALRSAATTTVPLIQPPTSKLSGLASGA